MVYTPTKALEVARSFHHTARQTGELKHPLLADSLNEDFPSYAEFEHLSKISCCEIHLGHNDPHTHEDECYWQFLSLCYDNEYAPSLGDGSEPFDKNIWTGQAPIIEHVRTALQDQDRYTGGGSWKNFLSETIMEISTSRQATILTNPDITTIIFGISSKESVRAFTSALNNQVSDNMKFKNGRCPSPFYSLSVSFVLADRACKPRIEFGGQKGTTIELNRDHLPARISFGFLNSRYDVVFPWTSTHTNASDFSGDYILQYDKSCLENYWIGMFSELEGLGIASQDELERLLEFLKLFKFRNGFKPPQIRTMNLEALLVISGYNHSASHIAAANFFFVGGFVVDLHDMFYGLGKWASEDLSGVMEKTLNIFLQSKIMAVVNVAMLSSITWLLHWFPTPGLSAILTGKGPVKFLEWFARFQKHILADSKTNCNIFRKAGNRVDKPCELFKEVQLAASDFTNADLASCNPDWSNVTFGGCPSDVVALTHYRDHLLPVLSGKALPIGLRISSNFLSHAASITGSENFTAKGSNNPGCNFDSSILRMPESAAGSAEAKTTVRESLRKFRENNLTSGLESKLTGKDLEFAYVWTNPERSLELFRLTFKGSKAKFFKPQHAIVLMPILEGFSGQPLKDPLPIQKLRKKWNVLYTMKHYTMIRRKWKSATGKSKTNLEQRIKRIEKKLNRPKAKVKGMESAFKMMASCNQELNLYDADNSSDSSDSDLFSFSDSSSSSSMSEAETEQEDPMDGEEMEIVIGCNDLEGEDLIKEM